jgi:AraC family transcriptional regulator
MDDFGLSPDDRNGAEHGLAFCKSAISDAVPRYVESDIIAPTRHVGLGAASTLKATFWQCNVDETVQLSELDFVGIALNTGGRVWRDNAKTPTVCGGIAMMPFEGARWRFDGPASFIQLYVPFRLLGDVSDSLFERELRHSALRTPCAIREGRLCRTAHAIGQRLEFDDANHLVLDSWALILAETLLRDLARQGAKPARTAFGKIPAHRIARVIDYIESHVGDDLDLASLSTVAAMSVYHFARCFKETTGVSPHAYVLSRRIRRAATMLGHGDVGIALIAATCGFSSQAHLTTVFQRRVGVTPGQYRRAVSG